MTKKEMAEKFSRLFANPRYDDWGLIILASQNGFVVRTLPDGALEGFQGQEDDENKVAAANELLCFILDYFNVNPSRYARRRLWVIEEVGDKYELQPGEKLVREKYYRVEESI